MGIEQGEGGGAWLVSEDTAGNALVGPPDHLGQELLHHNLGTMHTLAPKASSTHRMGAMGCSAVGTVCSTTRSIRERNVGKRERGPSQEAVKGRGTSPHGDYTTDIPATTA